MTKYILHLENICIYVRQKQKIRYDTEFSILGKLVMKYFEGVK